MIPQASNDRTMTSGDSCFHASFTQFTMVSRDGARGLPAGVKSVARAGKVYSSAAFIRGRRLLDKGTVLTRRLFEGGV